MKFDSDKTSQDIKAGIAKVLASENISVVFKAAKTASFDPIGRVLTIPNYKDGLSREMYDLFIGHEVGHALYTPQITPNKVDPSKANFGSFVNVVEDVRIEKMIKKKFAGLIKSFRVGYDHLVVNKFFGDFDEKPLAERSFGDRVNIHFKVGVSAGLVFEGEELEIVEQIAEASTWDDVVKASHRLYDHCMAEKDEDLEDDGINEENDAPESSEDQNEEEIEQEKSSEEGEEESEEESEEEEETKSAHGGDDGEEDEDAEDEEDEDNEDAEDSDSDEDSDEEELENNKGQQSAGAEQADVTEAAPPTIETQDTFEEMTGNDLIEDNDGGDVPINVYFPKVNDSVVLPWKDVYADLIQSLKNSDYVDYEKAVVDGRKLWNATKIKNRKIVSFMVKEFEMRKSADEHKRTSTAKTGVLDTGSLHKYRFSEDLFKKHGVVLEGKNHGLVMIIDWSGSMAGCLSDTIDQLQVLAMFCNKVNIPYEVYAFNSHASGRYLTDDSPLAKYMETNAFSQDKGDMAMNDSFRFVNYLSSGMKGIQFDKAMCYLEMIKESWRGGGWNPAPVLDFNIQDINRLHNLGGTPLNEAMVAGADVVMKFKKQHNVQIVNTVFLTDGEGHRNNSHYIDDEQNTNHNYGRVYYHDRNNKMVIRKDSGYYASGNEIFIDYFKNHTDGNLINFYVCDKKRRTFQRSMNNMGAGVLSNEQWDKVKKNGFIICDDSPYTSLFIIGAASLHIEDGTQMDDLEAGATKAQIKSALSKDAKGAVKSRMFLAEFMKMVA